MKHGSLKRIVRRRDSSRRIKAEAPIDICRSRCSVGLIFYFFDLVLKLQLSRFHEFGKKGGFTILTDSAS